MDKYVIEGGRPLYGEVEIQSAKNAVLPLLAASVLTDEQVVIRRDNDTYDIIHVSDWVDHDDVLDGQTGY